MKRMMELIVACIAGLALSSCESIGSFAPFTPFHVNGIVPGTSVAKDVEAKMGPPAEKIGLVNGDSVWFYPRNRAERQTIAVRISADGVVRSVEESLEPDNLRKIVAAIDYNEQ